MKINQKRFNTFRQGRISLRKELRQQMLIRNNLEKRNYKRLNTLFRKFANVQLHLFKEYGVYNPSVAIQTLNEDLFPLMLSHYKRIFKTIYKNNESKYYNDKKNQEAFVFGRSVDFEKVVENYFSTRQLLLTGISIRLANRISKLIEDGRINNLTLPEIARSVSDNFLPISRNRAALIARTETHNAASFANHTYHKQVQTDLGLKMVKRWVSTNDARTRPAHSTANGQTVDMDEKFNIGGAEMEFAGDTNGGAKNVVNCRCVIVYADDQDIVLD